MTTTLRWLMLGSVLGFAISMGMACGTAGKCNPSNCSFGCCDTNGNCQMPSQNFCGQQGRACQACFLGQVCNLGVCMANTTGGGTGAGGGQGGGTTGGGTTGGGTTGGGTTGGGTTGGGTTGGGTTGGGTTGGGTGGGTGLCATLQSNSNTFFAGMAACGEVTANQLPLSTCSAALASCSASDQQSLSSFGTCIASVPCTTGNEMAAQQNFFSCLSFLQSLSTPCQQALSGTPPTGGGGGTGGGPTGGGPTGGGPTGGGPTGGGPMGGGAPIGGGAACTAIGSFPTARQGARYLNSVPSGIEFTFADVSNTANDPSDVLRFELIWALGDGTNPLVNTGIVVPGTRNLATEGSYFQCEYCAVYKRGCTGNSCTGGSYLGQLGTMSVSSGPRMASGTFAASLSNVTFYEWDLMSDMPIPNGRCYTLSSFSVSGIPVMP